MNNAELFANSISEMVDKSLDILIKKGKSYSSDEDRLHNFRVAAALQGISEKEALAGMLAKHLVSVFDMVKTDESRPRPYSSAVWDEKIGDAINYLLILRAMVDIEREERTSK